MAAASTATTRKLRTAPGALGLYAKAALPLVPGASLLPFVAGGGSRIPRTTLTLDGVGADPAQLAAYARVCGFTLRDTLPSTYLHIRAFPLHLALMTDPAFPFPAVGLVHLRNRITQFRPVRVGERVDLRVFGMPLQPHPKGRTFTIVSEAYRGDELVWQDASTMLRRGKGSGPRQARAADDGPRPHELPFVATWRLPADLGRRYGAASGDRNPIHIHPLTARLLGFPRAIAHGMWTKARCLAALESQLPDAYTVDVSFRAPILLPATVTFAAEDGRFAVRSARDEKKIHLEGKVTAA